MNIAFICYEAFLSGGIRVYTREILNRIVSEGHRVVLFAPPPLHGSATGLADDIEMVKIGIPAIPLLGPPIFGLRLPRAFRNAERDGGRFEIVHSIPKRSRESEPDRKSTRLNSSHGYISYAVFCLKKKKKQQ